MLKLLLFLILFNSLQVQNAQEVEVEPDPEECSLGDIESVLTDSNSLDTDEYYFRVNNMKYKTAKITACDGSDRYVEGEYGVNYIAAKVKNMEEIEETHPNSRNGKPMCFNVEVDCKNYQKKVDHLLMDTNNHPPKFINNNGDVITEYTFTLPMPFPASITLDQFGDQIRAKDIDFMNMGMTFEIKAIDGLDDLKIEYGSVEPTLRKIHSAVLKSTKSLSFDEKKYIVTATDAGFPKKESTTATIILKKSKESSVVYPAFEKTYYKALYNVQENEISGLPAIKLEDGEGAVVSLEEEGFQEYFTPVYKDGVVYINIEKPFEDNDVNVIILSLDASVKNEVRPAKTVVILEIVGRTTTQPPTTTTTMQTTTTQTTTSEGENPGSTTTQTTTSEGENPGSTTTQTTTSEGENPGSTTAQTTTSEGENPSSTTIQTTTSEGENPGSTTTQTTTSEGENPGSTTTQTTTSEGENPGSTTTQTTTSEGENPGSTTTQTTTSEGSNPGTTTTQKTTTEGENPGTTSTQKTTTDGENPITTTTQKTTTSGENPGSTTPGSTTTCSPGGEITTAPSTTTTEEPATIKFVEYPTSFYFHHNENIPLKINTFLATSTDVRDSIIYKPESFPSGLAIDPKSGDFSVVSDIESGKYRLKIDAVGSYSGQKDTAQFVLEVGSTVTCGDEERTAYSFLVKTIAEEQTSSNVVIVKPENEEYEYCIYDQYPNNGKFYINKNTRDVECESLDREDTIFKNMAIPQYTLILQLQKKTDDGKCIADEETTYKSEWDFIEGINMYEKIKNSPTQTVVNVLIEDVNDHNPIFSKSEITVCYPEKDIANEIRPSYLTKVYATDEDAIESTFGLIKYSSGSSEVVVREDGVIYPTDSIYKNDDKFEFEVIATDGGGKTGKQKIKVKFIEEDNIGILTLQNIPTDKIEEELAKLSSESNFDLRMLSAAAVPQKGSDKARSNYYQEIYIYGLKNNVPIEIKDIKDELENVEISKYEPSSKEDIIVTKEAKVTGWIAAVSVLAVLLVIVLCGGIAFWYFKLRNTTSPYDEMEDKDDEKGTFDKMQPAIEHFENVPNVRRQTGYVFNPPPPEEDDETKNVYSVVDYSKNIKLEEPSAPYENSFYQTTEEDEKRERRKSVSFNDLIERIKITKTEPANDDEDEDEDKDKEKEKEILDI